MINKESISFVLKDESKTAINFESIINILENYEKKDKLDSISIITNDTKYYIKAINKKTMLRIKEEIQKRIIKDEL